MIEVLEFIFQDIWHFIGMFLLVGTISCGLGSMFSKTIIYKNKDDEEK